MPRKYTSSFRTGRTIGSGFNEAGADAPEIPSSPQRLLLWQTSFNEAGADAPEILGVSTMADATKRASMRPGRMPRKYRALAIGPVAWSFDRFCE